MADWLLPFSEQGFLISAQTTTSKPLIQNPRLEHSMPCQLALLSHADYRLFH